MTRTIVDTSVILSLLYPDEDRNQQAAALLQEAAESGALLVNPVIYAELAADSYFESSEDLDGFLADTGIVVEQIPADAQFAAGNVFSTYLDRRGSKLQCPECGHRAMYTCPECDADITARQHIAADFLIGAHAEQTGALLTFDDGFYRDYFDIERLQVADN